MEPFIALLVSADPGSLVLIQRILEDNGVNVKVANSAAAASQLIKTTMFDLGIFDHDVPQAVNPCVARSEGSNPKMIFALLRGTNLKEIVGKRVHFVLQKPFSADLFTRSLRAAYGTMLRERRTTFRHPVQITPAYSVRLLESSNQKLQSSKIVDLSQSGMCIQSLEILPEGAALKIDFQLPDSKELIHVTGTVRWTRASGRTGIRFTHVPPEEQKHLIDWLDSKLPFRMEMVPRAAHVPVRRERAAEVYV
jgi:DNA-binding response OmpR family regulator